MEAPLIEAILQGDVPEIEHLLNTGANVDEVVDDDNENYDHDTTGLMLAISMRRADIVDILVKKGANLDAQNGTGWTGVMIAMTTGQRGIVKYLVNKGANLDLRTRNGHAAIFYACWNGDMSMINYLGKKTSGIVLQGTLDTLLQIQGTPRVILSLVENILNKKHVGGGRRNTKRRR